LTEIPTLINISKNKGWNAFSIKNKMVNTIDFTGCMVSAASQLCNCSMKAAIDDI
jgi:hypothetical protein